MELDARNGACQGHLPCLRPAGISTGDGASRSGCRCHNATMSYMWSTRLVPEGSYGKGMQGIGLREVSRMASEVQEQQNSPQSTTRRTRLTVDISPDLQLRIKVAAAHGGVTVRDLVENILNAAVPSITPDSRATARHVTTRANVEVMLRRRNEVLRDRRFADDSTDLLREARVERESQL